jgi:hypothetical protein
MKLLTKSTLIIATLSLFLFFIMGIIFFQVLKNMSRANLDRELVDLKEIVEDHIGNFKANQIIALPGIDSLSIQQVRLDEQRGDIFGDSLMYDAKDDQYKTYRFIHFHSEKGDADFQVTIFKSTNPTDYLVEQVTLMMTLMVILFLAGIFILNRFIFANLWGDFFEAIDKLKQFETTKEPVILREQDIQEFEELRKALEMMTKRLASDYKELKEYTDRRGDEMSRSNQYQC